MIYGARTSVCAAIQAEPGPAGRLPRDRLLARRRGETGRGRAATRPEGHCRSAVFPIPPAVSAPDPPGTRRGRSRPGPEGSGPHPATSSLPLSSCQPWVHGARPQVGRGRVLEDHENRLSNGVVSGGARLAGRGRFVPAGGGPACPADLPCRRVRAFLEQVRDDCRRDLGIVLKTEGSGSQEACRKVTELGRPCDLLVLADNQLVSRAVRRGLPLADRLRHRRVRAGRWYPGPGSRKSSKRLARGGPRQPRPAGAGQREPRSHRLPHAAQP